MLFSYYKMHRHHNVIDFSGFLPPSHFLCHDVMLDGEEDLERYLWKYLEGRSYLVVIDDAWDTEA